MYIKYEVAFELYKNNDSDWDLINVPQQVCICKEYEYVSRLYGPFNEMPFRKNDYFFIAVFVLYIVLFDDDNEVINTKALGYRLIMSLDKHQFKTILD